MVGTSPTRSEALLDEVFDLLKKKGPLCPSQISADLLLPISRVCQILKDLECDGHAERRPDPDPSAGYTEEEIPWRTSAHRAKKQR